MSRRPAYPPRSSTVVGAGQVPRPVIGLDIDGTLGVYHSHFLRFAEGWLGKPLPEAPGYRGGSLAAFMGVSRATYRRVKLAYRQGGMKRSMPVYPGASELTRGLRARGALVVLCTTRPYLHLSNIEPDTVEWAKRNGIQHDGFIFGEHKYRDLRRLVGPGRVAGVLEDLPEMYAQAVAAGLPAIVRHQLYNLGVQGPRARDLWAASYLLHAGIDNYEEAHRG